MFSDSNKISKIKKNFESSGDLFTYFSDIRDFLTNKNDNSEISYNLKTDSNKFGSKIEAESIVNEGGDQMVEITETKRYDSSKKLPLERSLSYQQSSIFQSKT